MELADQVVHLVDGAVRRRVVNVCADGIWHQPLLHGGGSNLNIAVNPSVGHVHYHASFGGCADLGPYLQVPVQYVLRQAVEGVSADVARS